MATDNTIAKIAKAKAPIVTRTISFEKVRCPLNITRLARNNGKFKLNYNLYLRKGNKICYLTREIVLPLQ